jgi:hypothetical protein
MKIENALSNHNCVIRYPVMVEWSELGEGWEGEYNENDPNDEELLRFDVSIWNCDPEEPWIAVEDASYCTAFPVNTDPILRERALNYIMDEIWEQLADSRCSIKRICEKLSWINPIDVMKEEINNG